MMVFGKWLVGGIVAIALVVLVWFISANHPANRCLEFYQSKAGATLKLVSSEQVGENIWLTVEGGPDKVRSTAVCQVNADGTVNSLGTDLAWITKLMDESIACHQRNNKLWDEIHGKYTGNVEDCGENAISRRSGWLRLFNDGYLNASLSKR